MPESTDTVRGLARLGQLADRAGDATGSDYTTLTAGAYDVVWPLVYDQRTKGFELQRGHPGCAASIAGLRPECLDRFYDDVEAVLEDLLRNAKVPIHNLEGWIVRRLTPATVDGHRRRRGSRGALQRPRMPGWLSTALNGDPWHSRLAIEILTWSGVTATAGTSLWPLNAWAELRSKVTGEPLGDERAVAADVETVLAAMRKSTTWYANFVERPLGRKQAPVAPSPRPDPDSPREHLHLPLSQRHEKDDARLAELAAAAVDAIDRRIRAGEDPVKAVAVVLDKTFRSGTGAEGLDMVPGTGPEPDERISLLLADESAMSRITKAALDILGIDPPE
ncbi:hypothetical protein OHA72_04685 [Dactylosporangium sp. NBC_01737]|uniref:hypothetical protein n=1 Tax=Dactylosporangium sp. NBC_01737 TaxID=2975959 RepID=UPI002E122AB8|nr:hypothetical protein OHA72_04685 [Dactylosporangium sp. NBC_01737]